MTNSNPTPESLNTAARLPRREFAKWCHELICYGDGPDYLWGYCIYRTVYTPEADAQMPTAMANLMEYMRSECFEDLHRYGGDDRPNRELWARLHNDVFEDASRFDGATPAAIQKHFEQWIHEQQPIELSDTSRYRFCIILDAEVLDRLLHLPMPPTGEWDLEKTLSVKVLDVERTPDTAAPYDPPFHEGWLWMTPNRLARHWFEARALEAEQLTSWEFTDIPVGTCAAY